MCTYVDNPILYRFILFLKHISYSTAADCCELLHKFHYIFHNGDKVSVCFSIFSFIVLTSTMIITGTSHWSVRTKKASWMRWNIFQKPKAVQLPSTEALKIILTCKTENLQTYWGTKRLSAMSFFFYICLMEDLCLINLQIVTEAK